MSQVVAREEPEFLRQSLIFENLDDRTVSSLLEGSLLQRFPAGTVLFNQGEVPDFLYLVLEGALELFTTGPDGDDTIIEILEAPDTYTVAPVLTLAPYLVSGRVVRAGRLLMLRGDVIRCLVATNLQLSHNMLGLLSRQFRVMVRQIKNLKLKTTAERLGCYIVSLHEEQGAVAEIALPYDKRRIADRLGMTPVSLSRAFARLAKFGVSVKGSIIGIRDIQSLRDFCKPDGLMREGEEDLRFVSGR
ncbi:MAG: cyclic nucleotide-binding domain-containing protein [Verrucomicrobia bacterium]|nr:cyclic nucleotide-binding domain-containing protein [Verrucomicrobiota bacterium]